MRNPTSWAGAVCLLIGACQNTTPTLDQAYGGGELRYDVGDILRVVRASEPMQIDFEGMGIPFSSTPMFLEVEEEISGRVSLAAAIRVTGDASDIGRIEVSRKYYDEAYCEFLFSNQPYEPSPYEGQCYLDEFGELYISDATVQSCLAGEEPQQAATESEALRCQRLGDDVLLITTATPWSLDSIHEFNNRFFMDVTYAGEPGEGEILFAELSIDPTREADAAGFTQVAGGALPMVDSSCIGPCDGLGTTRDQLSVSSAEALPGTAYVTAVVRHPDIRQLAGITVFHNPQAPAVCPDTPWCFQSGEQVLYTAIDGDFTGPYGVLEFTGCSADNGDIRCDILADGETVVFTGTFEVDADASGVYQLEVGDLLQTDTNTQGELLWWDVTVVHEQDATE